MLRLQVPYSNFVNSEYVTSFNKDILVIWFYANEPQNPELRKRLTMRHLAAIRKAEKVAEDHQKYVGLKITPEELTEQAVYLTALIHQINFCLQAFSDSGIKSTDDTRNKYVLAGLNQKFPEVVEKQLEEGYELVKFLDLLKRGINYETEYLNMLKEKFEKVPDIIRGQFLI